MKVAVAGETDALTGWKTGPSETALALLLGQPPAGLRLERVHFPGTRPVQLVYAARRRTGGSAYVLAEYCPGDTQGAAERAQASLRKSRNGQRSALAAAPVLADPGTGLVLRRPGLDERLPGLRVLHDAAFARETVARLIGRDLGPVRARLMAHRLGKRAVIRIETADACLYARLRAVKSGEGEARLARHRAIWEALGPVASLAVPEPLGSLPEIGLSLFAELPGGAPRFDRDAVCISRSLEDLRGLGLDGLPTHSGADEAGLLEDWHARCRRYHPALAIGLDRILPGVCRDLVAASGPMVPCHRDLHEKQILVHRRRAGLLDFDTVSLANPALDPGNLLAHLFFAGVYEQPLTRVFAGLDLPLWRRAALLRLAMIYAFSATPDRALRRLVEEAAR